MISTSPSAQLVSPASRTRIKMCGFTRERDVDAAVAAGADAIGFVLYAKSPRAVTPQRAAELASRDSAEAPPRTAARSTVRRSQRVSVEEVIRA